MEVLSLLDSSQEVIEDFLRSKDRFIMKYGKMSTPQTAREDDDEPEIDWKALEEIVYDT